MGFPFGGKHISMKNQGYLFFISFRLAVNFELRCSVIMTIFFLDLLTTI